MLIYSTQDGTGRMLKHVILILTGSGDCKLYKVVHMRVPQLQQKGIWLIPFFLLFTFFQAKSQNETGSIPVTGKITDEKGNGIPNATVLIKGTAKSVSAKEDGSFSINVVTGKETLVISSVGFSTKEFPLKGETSVII